MTEEELKYYRLEARIDVLTKVLSMVVAAGFVALKAPVPFEQIAQQWRDAVRQNKSLKDIPPEMGDLIEDEYQAALDMLLTPVQQAIDQATKRGGS